MDNWFSNIGSWSVSLGGLAGSGQWGGIGGTPDIGYRQFGFAPGEYWHTWDLPYIPMGQGTPYLPGGTPIPTSQSPGTGVPDVVVTEGDSGTTSGPPAEYPEGSIFGPGGIWGPGSWERDFPDIIIDRGDPEVPEDEKQTDVRFIPTDASGGDELEPGEDEDMASPDWGDIARGVLDIFDPPGVVTPRIVDPPNFVPTVNPVPGIPGGGQYYVDPKTGQVCKRRRRRRRRLLTPTDLSDLAALQALVGKGSSALNMAVAKAVRR